MVDFATRLGVQSIGVHRARDFGRDLSVSGQEHVARPSGEALCSFASAQRWLHGVMLAVPLLDKSNKSGN